MLSDRTRSSLAARLCGLLLSLSPILLMSGATPPDALPVPAFEQARPLACNFDASPGALTFLGDLPSAEPHWMNRAYAGQNRWERPDVAHRGSSEDALVLTWSYVPDGTMIWGFNSEPSSPSNMQSWLDSLYPGGFPEWHALIASAFQGWADITEIQFVFEPNDDGANFLSASGVPGVRGDIRLAAHYVDGLAGNAAYAFPPNIGGEMVIDSHDAIFNITASNSLRLRNVIAHEIGHNLGLSHACPATGTKLMEPGLSDSFSGPQFDDMLNAHSLYGDASEPNDSTAGAKSLLRPAHLENLSVGSVLDEDLFRIALLAGERLDVTVTPTGPTYLRGPVEGYCATGEPFNAQRQRDLRVELLGQQGQTLHYSDDGRLGEGESFHFVTATAGTYYVRVSGDTSDNVQAYQLDLSGAEQMSFASGFEDGGIGTWTAARNYE